LFVVFVSLVFASLPAVSRADHAWGDYHWARTSNPFNLKLGDNLTSNWDPILSTTSSDWSASSVLNTAIVAGQARGRNCKPTSGRVEVCNAAYGFNNWLGLAQIWVSGDHITQGVTKVNDSYFNTATYNTTAWRNLVLCQEVGHTLGLDHQDENFNNANLGTCMDYTNNPQTNQHPNQHDYDQLEEIYAHSDGSTTVGQAAPPAMGQIDLDGPGQWGRLVSSSRNGKAQTFELDFGGGHKIFTFVIWVDNEGASGH
jgi:hypothetical protein